MTWIFIRHAHRDTTIRALDNGLSGKGEAQARRLLKYFKNRFPERARGIVLLSSPKRRCAQTLEPIAKYCHKKLIFSDLLLEQKSFETDSALRKRVLRFLREHVGTRGTIVVCSHGDWMPIAVRVLCGVEAELKKGSWAEVQNGKLVHLLQPDDL